MIKTLPNPATDLLNRACSCSFFSRIEQQDLSKQNMCKCSIPARILCRALSNTWRNICATPNKNKLSQRVLQVWEQFRELKWYSGGVSRSLKALSLSLHFPLFFSGAYMTSHRLHTRTMGKRQKKGLGIRFTQEDMHLRSFSASKITKRLVICSVNSKLRLYIIIFGDFCYRFSLFFPTHAWSKWKIYWAFPLAEQSQAQMKRGQLKAKKGTESTSTLASLFPHSCNYHPAAIFSHDAVSWMEQKGNPAWERRGGRKDT